jgi:hypothetical protein
MSQPKFALGRLVATPGALRALARAGEDPLSYVSRHVSGDWGDLCDDDKKENDYSIANELRILSAYTLSTGVKIWIITEADRSSTCVLLPSEY